MKPCAHKKNNVESRRKCRAQKFGPYGSDPNQKNLSKTKSEKDRELGAFCTSKIIVNIHKENMIKQLMVEK